MTRLMGTGHPEVLPPVGLDPALSSVVIGIVQTDSGQPRHVGT